MGGDLAAQRLRRSGKEAAAARSTGLRPIHFIHFIEAAVSNRVPNLLEGISNHYRLVMFGKAKFLLATSPSLYAFANRIRQRNLIAQ